VTISNRQIDAAVRMLRDGRKGLAAINRRERIAVRTSDRGTLLACICARTDTLALMQEHAAQLLDLVTTMRGQEEQRFHDSIHEPSSTEARP
jgi:hypothetical protein